jgi:glycosyltransferase involved in cell wall biosynthesis
MTRVGVMHLIDTLEAGGAERMAVNLANHLPQDSYRAFLCTTRREGPLAAAIGPHVIRLSLGRRWSFDVAAIRALARFIHENRIDILHAHSSSLFIAALSAGFHQSAHIVWHVHYGRLVDNRNRAPYRLVRGRISGVIAVSNALAAWSRTRLHIPAGRIWYIPNFTDIRPADTHPELPGRKGSRIVHVANLRPEKDHPTLLRAFAAVASQLPEAHLLLAGGAPDPTYRDTLLALIRCNALENRVTMLGSRPDIAGILAQCDVGVLSSASEGLPVSLIEYGLAGLPAVATDVGQCREVLDEGHAGVLVPPGDAPILASALSELLQSAEQRSALGSRLLERVHRRYSAETIVHQVCNVYDKVLQN